jgi:hypothetical protein
MTLDELFIKYGSDKSSQHHNYSSVYEELLEKYKSRFCDIFSMGIGGYHHTDRGGGDLRAFRDYLPLSRITAVDLYDKSFLNEFNIITHICAQDDEKWLPFFCMMADIIIDDCSHISPLTIKSFELLFPKLERGGLYIIEDTHSSYWDEIATDGTNFGGGNHPDTTMNYFKALCDHNLNSEECKGRIPFRDIEAEKFPIQSIQFYNKMIIIKKK